MQKVLLIFYFFNTLLLFSQKTEITGIVTDAHTGNPLMNAHVILKEINKATSTDAGGRFKITEINYGQYILNVSYLGYNTYEKKIDINKSNKHFYKISLKDSVITSNTFMITAPKELLLKQPRRISLITASEIAIAPVQQINDILDYSTGVSCDNTTGIFSSKTIITMRGLPANEQSRTLVILDGVPLNKADEGSVNWNLLNKNTIEQVKIIKGPGSAKYGSGAMGGVIEMTSKKPEKPFEGDIQMSYGSLNTISSNMSLSGIYKNDSLNNWYWLINGFGRKSEGYISTPDIFKTIDDTILVPTYLKELNTLLKAGYNFKNTQNIEAQFSFYDDMRGNGVQVFDNYGAFSKHLTYKGLLRYSGSSEFVKWQIHAYNTFENYYRIYEYMNDGEYKLYEADAIRGDRGFQCDFTYFRLKKHKIGAGLNLKNGSVDGTDTYFTSTDIIRNTGKMDNYAVYVMDDFQLSDNFLINAGLRYDFARFYDALFSIDYPSYTILFYKQFEVQDINSKNWDAITPRLSLQYNFNEKKRIFLSFARGFRAPVLDDMSRTGKKQGGFKVANPNLAPELIYSSEIGADWNMFGNVLCNVSLYYSIGKDFMYYTSTGDSVNMGYKLAPIFKKQNIGKVEIAGVETEVKYNICDGLTSFINYSFTRAVIIEHNVTDLKVDSNLTGKHLTNLPSHKMAGGLRWQHKIASISIFAKYYGKTWINEWNTVDNEYFFSDRFEDYFIMNIRCDKTIKKHFYIALQLENIFNKKFINSNLEQSPGRMMFVNLGIKI